MAKRNMSTRGEALDKQGRTWTSVVLHRDEAESRDFDFWFDGLSPEERVEAVDQCLVSCLKTRGDHGIPRLRRVHRVVKRKRR